MDERHPFQGFLPPTSNTTYTPNQFFDVVLRRGSRGAVRLVSYLIRKTLGWCDAEGRPQESQITVSYRELERHGGIGHSSIASAVHECLNGRYISLVRTGRADERGRPAISACYELRWDARARYVTDPGEFDGFYAGNGNLTYIPNQFFDELVPTESLSVLRVVGAIIRRTIGFQTSYGFRRQEVRMSQAALQRYTVLSHEAVRLALKEALGKNYVVCLEKGVFDPAAGQASRPAAYGLLWRDAWNGECRRTAQCQPAAAPMSMESTSTGLPLLNVARDRAEGLHADRSEKWHGKEITPNNTGIKQQQAMASPQSPVVAAQVGRGEAAAFQDSISLLGKAGFDSETTRELAARFPMDRIARQCAWLARRGPRRNRLGLLRKAIEGDWPEPHSPGEESCPGAVFASAFYAASLAGAAAWTVRASPEDIAQAESLLERIASAGVTPLSLKGWGAEFARQVLRLNPRGPGAAGQLAAAVLAHGDGFVNQCLESRRRALRREMAAARNKHQAQHRSAYLAYLRAQMGHLREQEPEGYREFERADTERRGKLGTGFVSRAGLTARMTEIFDREEERLTRFQAFFDDHPEHPVLGFWDWDEKHNPQGLRAAGSITARNAA